MFIFYSTVLKPTWGEVSESCSRVQICAGCQDEGRKQQIKTASGEGGRG